MAELATQREWRSLHVHNFYSWPGYSTLGDRVRAEQPDLFMHVNARQEDIDTLPSFVGFHVIRDPRDIIVSGYFSHLYSHPTDDWPQLIEHREKLQDLDINEGLFIEIEWSSQWLEFMSTWRYGQPNVLELRLEEMSADPLLYWDSIISHLGIADLPDGYLNAVLDKYSFERLSGGRTRGQEDKKHHYRRGVAGDWRSYLTSSHLSAFRERYGDLAERLGYDE